MLGSSNQLPYDCARCLHRLRRHNGYQQSSIRCFSKFLPLQDSAKLRDEQSLETEGDKLKLNSSKGSHTRNDTEHIERREKGAMSRRLAEATEDALLEGGRAGRRAVEEAGFSDDLKQELLERVISSKFRSENARAFAEAGISPIVGKGSREIATGQPWDGRETPEDTMLRMLNDSRKPLKPNLRGPSKIHNPTIDLRLQPKPKLKASQILANARDKTSIYTISKDSPMTDQEREDLRNQLKERFMPGARAMPTSFRGLAALANERIEDAISRGQFKVLL
jgi:hypothetical protein